MRIWHLLLATFATAVLITVCRDLQMRIFLVMLASGITLVVCVMAAIMSLFTTIGAIGKAREASEYAGALVASLTVLAVCSASVCAVVVATFFILRAVTHS